MRFRNASNERIRLESGARMDDDTCCCVECADGCDGPVSLLLDIYEIESTPADHEDSPNLPGGEYAVDFHGSSSTNYLGVAWAFSFDCGWIGPVAGVMCVNTGTVFDPVFEDRDVRPMYYEVGSGRHATWIYQGATVTTWTRISFSVVDLDTESTADTNRPCSWVPYEGEQAGLDFSDSRRDCADASLDTVDMSFLAHTVKVYAP